MVIMMMIMMTHIMIYNDKNYDNNDDVYGDIGDDGNDIYM